LKISITITKLYLKMQRINSHFNVYRENNQNKFAKLYNMPSVLLIDIVVNFNIAEIMGNL